ncbi:MAG TPA: cytochrome c [Coriobacteriia bacterium]
MKKSTMLLLALVLVVVGATGLVLTFVFGGPSVTLGAFSSNGQRIYYTGADAAGPIPRTVAGAGVSGFGMMGNGMMGDVACVGCHGEDGRGGRVRMMLGTVDIADVRYSTLATPRSEEGTTVPGWTDSDIARAIRDGVEPNGQPLKAPMPRWSMSDADIADVIAYLKELSAR